MARGARSPRPDPAGGAPADRLLAMVMALAGEVSVLRERLDTIERLAAAKGVFSAGDIDAYEPDEAALAARDRWRAGFLDRVLRIVHAGDETDEAYAEIVREISVETETPLRR